MNYSVSFDAAALLQGLNLQLEAAITQAVQSTAMTAQAAWQQTVLQTPGIWQPIRDRYAASIKVEFDPNGMGARIYSDDAMATPIETGIPERDLKDALRTSLKTRISKKGERYLIIPFRHNTSGGGAHARVMPSAVYAKAKGLTKSSVTGQGMRENSLGVHSTGTKSLVSVRSFQYKWGGRLPAGLSPKLRAHHVTDIHAGMVRMNTSSGGQSSSAFMTFRVMTESSKGWKVPAQPGRYIAKAISEQAQQMLRTEVQAAIASVS